MFCLTTDANPRLVPGGDSRQESESMFIAGPAKGAEPCKDARGGNNYFYCSVLQLRYEKPGSP
jgi:hypothetical protein